MEKTIVEPRTLPGFMELLPGEQQKFEQIKSVLENVYRLYGFTPLDTPVLESSEILLAKAGGETEKQIYRFNKGDSDLTMRFDLTVPLAKYVALHAPDLAFPFRRYQIGKVYRGERAQRGRFREFYQADIDIIGDGKLSIFHDAEIPSIIYHILTKLGIEDFVIRMNNRKILSGFFDMMEVRDRTADILRIVDKIDKIGIEKVQEELKDLGVGPKACESIVELIAFKGTKEQIFAKLDTFAGKNDLFDEGLADMKAVVGAVRAFGLPDTHYTIDLSIARGLDYYTGTVYETTLLKHPEIGSICSGGRYDNLAEYYTNRKLPGVGMSIGLTRLFFILNDKEYLSGSNGSAVDVMIMPMTDDLGDAIALSEKLRAEGIRTQLYLESGKFKSKMHYADRMAVPYVIFLGEDEIKEGLISLKDMTSGDQSKMDYADCVARLKERIAQSSDKPIVQM
ncbi:MAG: histidine--tRNA ligase [Clostridia bacterium]|nr:histidine--tRNA ligase [Clostridia bacterium]